MKKIISLLLLSVALVSEAESFEVGGILYDKLADTMRSYLDMEEIYGMLREARLG